MPKFSLLNVTSQKGKLVDGYWIQNHIGTLETAVQRARAVNTVNGNKLNIAVVDEVSSPVPALTLWQNQTRLD